LLDRGVISLQVLGDSKLILDWVNDKNSMENSVLQPLTEKLREVKNQFNSVSFHHMYRELNEFADQLSKEALTLHEGLVITSEWIEGKTSPKKVINLY
jgi:ribonuclease HI